MKSTLKNLLATAGIGAMLLAPTAGALAADNPFTAGQKMADQVAGAANIKGQGDVYSIVGNIINVILSLLGLIFLLLVLYAGFLWMTAGGDSKKVDEAKTIIRQAIIGLIVIMAGYAISNFVLGSLANVTGSA